MKHVAVIGGGAAGLASALMAARCGARVTVLEATDRVGQKILRTGNGRCNLTNTQVTPLAYNAPSFVEPAITAYGPERVRAFFAQLGLLTVEEREGRVYPRSNSANSVLDCLRLACECMGVHVRCGFEAVDVSKRGDEFTVLASDGAICKADALVVATGGATELLAECGHTVTPFKPVLCALKTQTDMFRGLSGVRVHAQVSAYDRADSAAPYAGEYGEVLFRDYGLSGIVVFDMSRVVEPGHYLSLDLLPDMSLADVEARLKLRYDTLAALRTEVGAAAGVGAGNEAGPFVPSYEDLLCGMFHPRVAVCVLRTAKCRPSGVADPAQFAGIARTIKDWRTQVTGFGDPKHAQVTRGGALVDEFDARTMESRRVPSLFAAGECLNVDARCGGYNLHWAWASGLTAGHEAAR